MSRTKGELSRLQDEEAQLEQSLLSGRVQLDSIVKSLKTTQEEINQVGAELRAGNPIGLRTKLGFIRINYVLEKGLGVGICGGGKIKCMCSGNAL